MINIAGRDNVRRIRTSMTGIQLKKFYVFIIILFSLMNTACVGTAIETATDAAIAVAKVPFKVVGAAADVVSGDEDEDD